MHPTVRNVVVLSPLGGPGTTPVNTLVAGAGSFLLSGDTMTPIVDYRLPAGAGSFTFTGTAATLRATKLLSAAAGSFAFTGDAATLTRAASSITWNPSDKHADITLTGSDLIATRSTAYDATWKGVRGTGAGRSTGKYCFQVTVTSPNISIIGIGNASAILTGNPTAVGNADHIGWASSGTFIGATASGPIAAYVNGDVLTICVDLTAKLFWGRVGSGNWNNNGSADPATGTGGVNMNGGGYALNAGPYFPLAYLYVQNAAFTADFAPASPPSGFGNW